MTDKITFMFDGCTYELHSDGYAPISRLIGFLKNCCHEHGYEIITNQSRFYDPVKEYLMRDR